MKTLLIVGCGFVGEAAAALFSGRGWKVTGVTASANSARQLEGCGFEVRTADVSNLDSVRELSRLTGPADGIIHCASSGRGGAEAYQAVYVDGLGNLAATYPGVPLLFTGSTSVYGQTDGGEVSENSPTEPDRETGRLLLEAEQVALSTNGWVLRLAGLYGPGRSVYVRKFLAGEAVLEDGGGRWINQLHRDDAASALFHVLDQSPPSGVYNVVDDTPCTQREVYAWLAAATGRPLPPVGPANLNRKRGWTSKRVSNARLKASGWVPSYPSFRQALPDLTL